MFVVFFGFWIYGVVNIGNRFKGKKLLVYNEGIIEFIKSLIYFKNFEFFSSVLMRKNKLEKTSNCYVFSVDIIKRFFVLLECYGFFFLKYYLVVFCY